MYPFVSDKKQFLGSKDGQTCRYCSRGKPAVSFKKDAHAVPHLLGNRSIFAHYECDSCNEQFSVSLEDHLGKLLLPVRAVLGIRGKKGVPSFKTDSQRSRIDYKDGVMTVSEVVDDRISQIIPEHNQVVFSPDGHLLAFAASKSGNTENTVELWDLRDTTKSPTRLLEQQHGIGQLAFLKGGPLLAVGDENNMVYLWDVAAKKRLHGVHGGNKFALSPDGSGGIMSTDPQVSGPLPSVPSPGLTLHFDARAAAAIYANIFQAIGTSEEVILDLALYDQQKPEAGPLSIPVSHRLVLSWPTAERLGNLLLAFVRHHAATRGASSAKPAGAAPNADVRPG